MQYVEDEKTRFKIRFNISSESQNELRVCQLTKTNVQQFICVFVFLYAMKCNKHKGNKIVRF
jgi:hypothetical protein